MAQRQGHLTLAGANDGSSSDVWRMVRRHFFLRIPPGDGSYFKQKRLHALLVRVFVVLIDD